MAYTLKIKLKQINEALQVGDAVYYVKTSSVGENTGYSNPFNVSEMDLISIDGDFNLYESFNNYLVFKFGTVSSINYEENSINVTGDLNINPPTKGDYIFFTKDNIVNLGYIKGYYAEMKMISTENNVKSEIFRINLAADESSK
tara:strand:+ start:3563 stop:3994 length:432 start_codon:yes stop_codon:yes gene_type:complete